MLQGHSDALAGYFGQILARQGGAPPKLIEAMDYSLSAGGKRLRPGLVMECAAACAPRPVPAGVARSAMAAAAAMELIHTFSLVHDDLPAMDDDDMRRGRPTNHIVFGEAMAILAGDGMVALAFEVIASDADPAVAAMLALELAVATGPRGMIGGQVLDIQGENKSLSIEQLRALHRMKTGALLTASCRLGAIAGGAPATALAALTAYGQHLGLAFQIVDDVLDETASPEQMGKATGKDKQKGKNTYPSLLGLEGSRQAAREQLAASLAAIAPLGGRGDRLAVLARFVVDRQL